MGALILERESSSFRTMTRSKQASGLSVCLGMIASETGSLRVVFSSIHHAELAIRSFKGDKVVFGSCYFYKNELKDFVQKFPLKKFYIMIHSNAPFIAEQAEVMGRISDAISLGVGVIVNDDRLAEFDNRYIYLPNIYRAKNQSRIDPKNESLKVICAGSMRTMKNHITQAMGAILYADSIGKKLEFYCNMGRIESGSGVIFNLKSIFKNSKHDILSLPWFDHYEFIRSLDQYDIGLQVSLSESFNIVAADYTTAGLPMVVSDEVRWACDNAKAQSGSPHSIFEAIKDCHNHVEDNRKGLKEFSNGAKERWMNFLRD